MKLSENHKKEIAKMFKYGYSMSEVGVLCGLGTLEVEGIIREWVGVAIKWDRPQGGWFSRRLAEVRKREYKALRKS